MKVKASPSSLHNLQLGSRCNTDSLAFNVSLGTGLTRGLDTRGRGLDEVLDLQLEMRLGLVAVLDLQLETRLGLEAAGRGLGLAAGDEHGLGHAAWMRVDVSWSWTRAWHTG